METLKQRERRIQRLEEQRAKRRGKAVWPTSIAGGYWPDLPTALQMLQPRSVSFARLFSSSRDSVPEETGAPIRRASGMSAAATPTGATAPPGLYTEPGIGTYLMRMAGLRRADTVARTGNHDPSKPVGHVARMLLVASFPLRVLRQARQATKTGSAAAVHYYGPQT